MRWRRGEGRGRQRIKWLLYAVALTLFAVLFAAAGWYTQGDIPGVGSYTMLLAGVVAFGTIALGIPAAIVIAILGCRLYEIDSVVNRPLAYSSLTVMLAFAYFGGMTAAQALLHTLT